MLRATFIVAVLASGAAWAQQPVPGPAPVVKLTAEEHVVVQESLQKLGADLGSPDPSKGLPPDWSTVNRIRDIEHGLFNSKPEDAVDPTSLQIMGAALSRSSGCSDQAWALLQKILGPPIKGEVRVRPACVK